MLIGVNSETRASMCDRAPGYDPHMRPRISRTCLVALVIAGATACTNHGSVVASGDPDYPVANPHPAHVVRVQLTVPAGLPVRLVAFYQAGSPVLSCTRRVGLGVDAALSVYLPVSLKQMGDEYLGSVVSDRFEPGSCDWRIVLIWYGVRNSDPRQELAVFSPGATGGAGSLHSNVWCVYFPDQKDWGCGSLDVDALEFPRVVTPERIAATPVSERGEMPLHFGPATQDISVVFHAVR